MAAKKKAVKKVAKSEYEERMVGGQLRKVRVATGEIIEDVGTIEKIDGAHVPIPDGHVWDVKKGAILDPDGFVYSED
tara:strand:+ start:4020 stop:4250 length:231 start_codon:yes stop_codon:yes gene_type:complete